MITLGIPSKGRLQEETVAWFASRGVTLARTGHGREYAGAVRGIDGLELVLLSAGEIPRELALGRLHLGVTGQDLIAEHLTAADGVERVRPMGFGHADLVVAVPKTWIDCDTMDDLDAVAAAFRLAHGHRLRVATKYHELTRRFFARHGVADYRLVDSQGATEGTVTNRTAEAIADITTTGTTLDANHLKVLSDGLILASEATLFRARRAEWSSDDEATFDALVHQLEAA
ncbi:MAG: ATP phosphoribosyltransferase [Pseudomonadota bacterium]